MTSDFRLSYLLKCRIWSSFLKVDWVRELVGLRMMAIFGRRECDLRFEHVHVNAALRQYLYQVYKSRRGACKVAYLTQYQVYWEHLTSKYGMIFRIMVLRTQIGVPPRDPEVVVYPPTQRNMAVAITNHPACASEQDQLWYLQRLSILRDLDHTHNQAPPLHEPALDPSHRHLTRTLHAFRRASRKVRPDSHS